MTFKFTENKLIVNCKTVVFDDKIQEVVDFGDCLVIRTDYYKAKTNENVYGVNELGERTWQIKKMDKLSHEGKQFTGITEPYTGLTKIDEQRIKLFNWDSTNFEVDPRTGQLVTNPMDSRIGRRPW